MTALQTVPAGVARILERRAEKACAVRVELSMGQYWSKPSDASVNAAHAEKLAQEWLDGLARMELAPMEGAL